MIEAIVGTGSYDTILLWKTVVGDKEGERSLLWILLSSGNYPKKICSFSIDCG